MTASQLLEALTAAACRPGVDGADLLLPADTPTHLTPFVGLLHTGLRALLTRRPWVALLTTEGKPTDLDPLAIVLDPRSRLPARVKYLGVMGDRRGGWDKVTAAARGLPGVFAQSPRAKPSPSARQPRTGSLA